AASAAAIDPDTGHCYVAWDITEAWQLAQSDCQARGGMLPVITSAGEEAIVERIGGGVVRWIGLWRPAPGNPLTLIDGEPLGYMNFAPGQPSSIMETCVDLAPDGWHDVFCGFPLNGNLVGHANSTPRAYICEHTCGNGTIDPGEQCDPPGGDCTPAC